MSHNARITSSEIAALRAASPEFDALLKLLLRGGVVGQDEPNMSPAATTCSAKEAAQGAPDRSDIANLPELCRVDEARRVLRISKSTVYELIRRGDLPSVRLGRLVRVPRVALERFAAGLA
jgi:excisionase family DNA binding protein